LAQKVKKDLELQTLERIRKEERDLRNLNRRPEDFELKFTPEEQEQGYEQDLSAHIADQRLWILDDAVVELIQQRRKCPVGWAQQEHRDALASGKVRYNDGPPRRTRRDDLIYWLDHKDQLLPPKPKSRRPRRRTEQKRAERAFKVLGWSDGPPEELGDLEVLDAVNNWTKEDCKTRGVQYRELKLDSVLRAAKRRL
jgi:hypothetical protein